MNKYNKLWVSILGGVLLVASGHLEGLVDPEITQPVVALLTSLGVWYSKNA